MEILNSAQAAPSSGGMETGLLIGSLLVLGAMLLMAGEGRSWSGFRAGISLGVRGLMAKEVRSRSRGWRPMLTLTGYLGLISLALVGFLFLAEQAGATNPTLGLQLFSGLAIVSVLLLAFITPTLTVGAVSGERERRTLDLLLVTRASALGLATGKLLGSVFYILFLLVASLPAFALVYLFGGVPPLNLFMVLAVAAVTAVTCSALGLMLSALFKRTIVASVLAYLVVMGLVVGLPFVSAVLGVMGMARSGGEGPVGPPAALGYVSPLASVSSVLPQGGPDSAGGIAGILFGGGRVGYTAQQVSGSIARSVYVASVNRSTGQVEWGETWAPWVYHFVVSGLFTLFALLVSALALAPVKPWRRWRRSRAVVAA